MPASLQEPRHEEITTFTVTIDAAILYKAFPAALQSFTAGAWMELNLTALHELGIQMNTLLEKYFDIKLTQQQRDIIITAIIVAYKIYKFEDWTLDLTALFIREFSSNTLPALIVNLALIWPVWQIAQAENPTTAAFAYLSQTVCAVMGMGPVSYGVRRLSQFWARPAEQAVAAAQPVALPEFGL